MASVSSAILSRSSAGASDCYQQRMVETRRGMRLRTVSVCAY